MEKIYRVQVNSKGMPNFSTAVEVAYIQSEVICGNEHNCIMTIFGECSYAETGCGNCAVVEKVRKALSADRQQGEWIRDRYWSRGVGMGEEYGFFYKCSMCEYEVEDGYTRCGFNFCPNCGADMREGADDD